jgi:poly-beta-1,6-N-acetyl-D-glucosamine N-deacetylase
MAKLLILFLLSLSLTLCFQLPILSRSTSSDSPDKQPPASISDRSLPKTEAIDKPLSQTCQPKQASPQHLTSVFNGLTQVALWVGEPQFGINAVARNLQPQLTAYMNPRPFPELHEKAKEAKVPILMYHDILPTKQVFFDVTPDEFEQHLKLIKEQGATPISFDQLVTHLRTGMPLPKKPVMLTFDDGYGGHYQYVYPLLKKYGYPGIFSIYTKGVGDNTGRSHVSWQQLKEMSADPLVTIASHSVTHPNDLTVFTDDKLKIEIKESKRILEAQLGIPIRYFTYPVGKYDKRVADLVRETGYQGALTMNDNDERFAGDSESLLAIARFGQSKTAEVVPKAWGGPQLAGLNGGGFDFGAAIQRTEVIIDKTPLSLISGGKPITIHAKTRAQVPEILAGTNAIAGVDGGFFSLQFLDSNVMIGPVYSQTTQKFIPGNRSDNPKLAGRPLVLISPDAANFIEFDPNQHNTLAGIEAQLPNVTDAFVAAAWLVKDSQPQPKETFKSLFDFEASRHRAFWGINQDGQPTIGVSKEPIDSVGLGQILTKAGFRDAVMLDSGASTSLAYKNESLVGYTPRPVPHVVALLPAEFDTGSDCVVAKQ